MAYDKATDLNYIQRDVLLTSVKQNTAIPKPKQLKTSQATVIQVLNDLDAKMSTALDKSNAASKGVEDVKTNIINIVTEQITQKMTEIVSGGIQNDEYVPKNGQAEFALTKTPADKTNILFFVNGIKYTRNDFAYNEAANTVTWTGIKDAAHPKGFNVETTDVVSIVYMAKN